MSANLRIQWLHTKIAGMSYPNAKRLSERFGISHRQAQRDVDFLRVKLNAPLAFDYNKKGFYYTRDFSLPVSATSANDEDYTTVVSCFGTDDSEAPHAESTVIQLQLPYSAVIETSDKLAVVELGSYIKEKNGDNSYRCEFHGIEKFMSAILSLESDIKIVKPDWLKARIIRCAERFIRNNL